MKTTRSIDNPAGPERWNVAGETEVTVVPYTEFQGNADFMLRKG